MLTANVIDNNATPDSAWDWNWLGAPLSLPGVGTISAWIDSGGVRLAQIDGADVALSEPLDTAFGASFDTSSSTSTVILAWYSGYIFLIYFALKAGHAYLRVGYATVSARNTASAWTFQTLYDFNNPATPFPGLTPPYTYQSGGFNTIAAAVNNGRLTVATHTNFNVGAQNHDALTSFEIFFLNNQMQARISYIRLLVGDNVQPFNYSDPDIDAAISITPARPPFPSDLRACGVLGFHKYPVGE